METNYTLTNNINYVVKGSTIDFERSSLNEEEFNAQKQSQEKKGSRISFEDGHKGWQSSP